MIYCLKCRERTDENEVEEGMDKKGKKFKSGRCVRCNTKKSVFVKSDKVDPK